MATWNVVLFQRRWGWGIADIGFAWDSHCWPAARWAPCSAAHCRTDSRGRATPTPTMKVTVVAIVLMVVFGTLYPIAGTPWFVLALFAAMV